MFHMRCSSVLWFPLPLCLLAYREVQKTDASKLPQEMQSSNFFELNSATFSFIFSSIFPKFPLVRWDKLCNCNLVRLQIKIKYAGLCIEMFGFILMQERLAVQLTMSSLSKNTCKYLESNHLLPQNKYWD